MISCKIGEKMLAERIDERIYRILIPFEELTTTVYLLRYEEGAALIDSATYPSDIDGCVIPAIEELGIKKDDVKWLLLTHTHGDHAGGLKRLSELFPNAKIGFMTALDMPQFYSLHDGDILFGGLKVVHLPGHTTDSIGYLDTKTKTLLSGDCLQLLGVGKYRGGVRYPELYLESIGRLEKMDIERIVAAHEYDPLGSVAEGSASVLHYLRTCKETCPRK